MIKNLSILSCGYTPPHHKRVNPEYIRPRAYLHEIPVDGTICNTSETFGGTTDNFVVDDNPTDDLF